MKPHTPTWPRLALAATLSLTLAAASACTEEVAVAPSHALSESHSALSDVSPHQRYIVRFKAGEKAQGRAAVAAHGKVLRDLNLVGAVAAQLPDAARSALARNPHVLDVEVDQVRVALAETAPYGIAQVQADLVSDALTGNRTVCVIDSGYQLGHEDLPEANVSGCSDSDCNLTWWLDGGGHGTHVAGTIAALGGNGVGVVGVNPSELLNLYIVRVFGDDSTWAFSSDLILAAEKCGEAGANVISMSLGCAGGPKNGPFACRSNAEQAAFDTLEAAGVLSIAAASNDGNSDLSYPASYDSVISVAAIDADMNHASFSNTNSQVELSGPGVGVRSTVPMGTGSDASVQVVGAGYAADAMDGSPNGSASGALVICDINGDCGSNLPANYVCLIPRGTVAFSDKVLACQGGGGKAAIIYNDEPGPLFGTLGGVTTTIPSVGISETDGATLAGQGGEATTVTLVASNYGAWDGTSMATPHVAGVAALVWSHNPNWTNMEIRDALTATALDLGAQGRDDLFGFGLVQAEAALAYLDGGCESTEASETSCTDGFDNDCDGDIDAADTDCAPTCEPTEANETSCTDGFDNDCDGDIDAADTDCAPTCEPSGSTEVNCSDGIDNDCDGDIDAADSDCATGTCGGNKDVCSSNADCCSGNCQRGRCKGN